MATRREVLKAAAAAGGLLVFDRFGFAADDKKLLPMTPNITMGPFYPEIKPLDKDADLTQIAGRSGHAQGQILHVSGRVLNRHGDPVRNAKLELWQANAAGRYTHPSDPNKAPLDPNFEGYGEQLTDSEGRFHFKTIKPGAYPGLDGMGMRTPHIHFEIFGKQDRMVTQLFFPGEPLNEQDVIFKSVPRNQKGVIAQLDKNPHGLPAGEWLATWDIVLLQG